MSKTYLEELIPDEVIRRLKAGEVLIDKRNNGKIKYINGVFCYFCANGIIEYNVKFYSQSDYYFETPDELKLKVGKCYKTRDGRKAFVYLEVGDYFSGVVEGDDKIYVWDEKGEYSNRAMECRLDLISEWSDDNVAEDVASALSKLSGEFNADMSWEELVEKAKKLGYEYSDGVLCNIDNSNAIEFTFDRYGNIWVGGQTAVEGRTPAQIYQIMLALED